MMYDYKYSDRTKMTHVLGKIKIYLDCNAFKKFKSFNHNCHLVKIIKNVTLNYFK